MEKWKRWAWFSTVLSIGLCYGGVRGILLPTQLDGEIGKPLTALATVQTVTSSQAVSRTYLLVHAVQTPSGVKRCNMRVMLWESGKTPLLHVGDAVQVQGTLVIPPLQSAGGTPIRAHLRAMGIHCELEGKVVVVNPAESSAGSAFRRLVSADISAVPGISGHQAALTESIVFGGSQMDAQTKQAFLVAGLLHVLAASGANVMILESGCRLAVYPLWRKLHLPHQGWIVALICFTWMFVSACGFDASVVRAACMTTYRLAGEWVGRRHHLRTSLIYTLLVMCLVSPSGCTSMSSVLSFVATGAICCALQTPVRPQSSARTRKESWKSHMAAAARYFGTITRTTVYVELFLLPLTGTVFHQFTPFSLLSNLIMDPLLAIILPLAAGWILLAMLAAIFPAMMGLVQGIGWGLTGLLACLENWVHWVAALPDALVTLPVIPLWASFPYYILLWCLGRIRSGRFRPRRIGPL